MFRNRYERRQCAQAYCCPIQNVTPNLNGAFDRISSQKPDEGLINKFKKTFPDVVSGASLVGDPLKTDTIDHAAVESVMQGR